MFNVHEIDSIVRKYFSVYEAKLMPEYLEYKVLIYPSHKETMKQFRMLWKELKNYEYLPTLSDEKGEYIIRIIPFPQQKGFSIWVNIILLIATLISTILVGASNYGGYFNQYWLSPSSILGGTLFFAIPLMAILGLHELGHYFAAKRNGVRASLPFFIPAPTMVGTLGAFISIREPIPDRKALLEIGASGPIVGFIVAIPIAIFGNYLGTIMHPVIQDSTMRMVIYPPLIYNIINIFVPETSYMFPMAFAAWVGFVVTAINLLPIGQLDGGHIARALLGNKSKYLSYSFFVFLLIIGLFYIGWLIFALFVLILGLNHPPSLNDVSKIEKKGYAIGIISILLISVTFVPVPINEYVLYEKIDVKTPSMQVPLIINCIENYTGKIIIKNTGDKIENVSVNAISPLKVDYKNYIGNLSVNSSWIEYFNVSINNNTKPGMYNVTFIFKTILESYSAYYNMSIMVFNKTNNIKFINPTYYTNVSKINESFIYTGNTTTMIKIWPINNASIFINNILMNNSAQIIVNPNSITNMTILFKNTGNYNLILYYDENATCMRISYV